MEALESAGAPEGALAKAGGFFASVRAELDKVTWPTREELVRMTRVILQMSVVLGIAIGLLDWVLQKVLVDGVARLAQ